MSGRIIRHISTAVLAVGALLLPADAAAQDGRFRVLIPDFFPAEGSDDDFGRDVAKELREILEEEAVRHVPIERDELRDGLRAIEVDMDELNCVGSRQFAPQVNAQVVVCVDYREAEDKMIDLTSVQFIVVPGGQAFNADPFSIHKDEKEQAARRIYDSFDTFVQHEQDRAYCFQYAELQQWEDAERNCQNALDRNEADEAVQFRMAQMYRQQENNAEALERIDKVLDLNPLNSDALYLGGFVATEMENNEQALDYFRRYLELEPDAALVRRRIAYDLAQQNDYDGAMSLLEEGMGPDADIGLYAERGAYAFRLAGQMMQGVPSVGGEQTLPPEVRALYETAISDLTRVFEVRGDSSNVGNVRNIINANVQLGELDRAITFGERAVETFPEEASIWVAYAQALGRAEKVDEALIAWQEVERLNPGFNGLYERQAILLLQVNRFDDAVPLLKRAVQSGFDPNMAARMLFNDAWNKRAKINPPDYAGAIEGIEIAKEFETDAATTSMLSFFHGFALFQQAIDIQEPETVQSARSALSVFQRARTLIEAGRSYATESGQNYGEVISAVDQYIEIQELIIERGDR